MQIVAYHLAQKGFHVTTITPHRFEGWFPRGNFAKTLSSEYDAIFLQHDNSLSAKKIRDTSPCPVYTFFGSYKKEKHGEFKEGFDYVCDPKLTMVENVQIALKTLLQINASSENGITPPPGLVHRKYPSRIFIQTDSSQPQKNFPQKKWEKLAKTLRLWGFSPFFLPKFPTLEELSSALYESGYFLGNDSGPGHLASLLQIPTLILGGKEKHLQHWKPGWGKTTLLTPPKWIPNFSPLRLREKKWKSFITNRKIIKTLKSKVLNLPK